MFNRRSVKGRNSCRTSALGKYVAVPWAVPRYDAGNRFRRTRVRRRERGPVYVIDISWPGRSRLLVARVTEPGEMVRGPQLTGETLRGVQIMLETISRTIRIVE